MPKRKPIPVPNSPAPMDIALGAYIPGASSDPTRIDAYASLVGRKPAIVNSSNASLTAYKAIAPAYTGSLD